MDSTAKFLLAVLILLPFDYTIIRFVDLFIYKLKNSKKSEQKNNNEEVIVDKEAEKEVPKKDIDKEFWLED